MKNRILDKLKKLLAHALSAKEIGNHAEVDAFLKQIESLLTRHDLTLEDVEAYARDTAPIGRELLYPVPRKFEIWQIALLDAVCKSMGCFQMQNLVDFDEELLILIAGLEHDRKAAITLFHRYQEFVNLKADEYVGASETSTVIASGASGWGTFTVTIDGGFYSASPKLRRFSYIAGLTQAICQKLLTPANDSKAEDEGQESQLDNAITPVQSKTDKAKERIGQKGEVSQVPFEPIAVDQPSYMAGLRAGQEIDIGAELLEE